METAYPITAWLLTLRVAAAAGSILSSDAQHYRILGERSG
jgi:hypothetical protein